MLTMSGVYRRLRVVVGAGVGSDWVVGKRWGDAGG